MHFKHRSFRIPIMRRRCPDCRKTFSLMPCFTSPWARFANHIYEFLGRWLMEGVPIGQLAQRLTTPSVSEVSLKTLYRWKHRFLEFWGKWWIDQRKKWASEFQEGESFLSLYREGIRSDEEIQLLLSFFFAEIGSVPSKGRLFSTINLRQPFYHN
ncbi:transposase [Heyndrickxia coagulans]|uniref:transposase n=1 Tax=Heyndrickxia coagulans TaxID=1398 RepID=UPI00399CAA7C